jgi:hypothetical protein
LQTKLLEHRSVKAWRELRPEKIEPRQIEVLKENKHRAVYRLDGVGPDNSAVIAKRALPEKAKKERTVYEDVLPRLPLPTLHYYGCVEEEDGRFWWLFLEDAGRQQYSPSLEAHRSLAALWFGRLHSSAVCQDLEVDLPDRGLGLYKTYLRSILELLPQREAISSLPDDDQAVLVNIAATCAFVAERWGQIEALCDPLPRAFIHDDCLAKNVHVRSNGDGLSIAPFDWGGAGWGYPATDLGQLRLPYKGQPPDNPDPIAYHAVVRDRWPSLDLQRIRQLVNLGQLFWSLKVISRGLPELDYAPEYLEHVMYNFRIYEAILADSVRWAKWQA